MASWRRAGANPAPSRVSRPKSETSSLLQSASIARALSSTRKRSSPWSSNAVALVPARGARGISRSYLQRQGDRALLVGAPDVGRKTRRHAPRPTRRDELRGGGDRDSFQVWREPAFAARGPAHAS